MSLRVCIHRGAEQVGGNCVELETKGQRLLLDLGMPLDAADGEVLLPPVRGLGAADPSLLGVLVSHLHGDHCGLVPYTAGLPLGMGPTAARILRHAEFFTRRVPLPELTWSLRDRQTFEIGPFVITPYAVEHSAFDALALLVEADGRRLFYTGDFRAHGNDRRPMEQLLRDPPRDVHVVLMEGTQLGHGRETSGPDEEELGRILARRFRDHAGLVLAAWSSQNLDRLRTMYRAARAAGRTLVVDLYTATLAAAAHALDVPAPGDAGLEVFCRERERVHVKEAAAFTRTQSVFPWRIFPEELAPRARDLVLMFRSSMIRELERAGALDEALAVWSMWRGYLDEPSGKHVVAELTAHGVPLEVHHVSGHAYVRDLQALIAALRPSRVVPIHTDAPARYASLLSRVERRRDGETWEV